MSHHTICMRAQKTSSTGSVFAYFNIPFVNEYRSGPRSYEHYWTSSWIWPENIQARMGFEPMVVGNGFKSRTGEINLYFEAF